MPDDKWPESLRKVDLLCHSYDQKTMAYILVMQFEDSVYASSPNNQEPFETVYKPDETSFMVKNLTTRGWKDDSFTFYAVQFPSTTKIFQVSVDQDMENVGATINKEVFMLANVSLLALEQS